MSFVVYNEDNVTTRFTVRVFDSDGFLVGTGVTPLLAPGQTFGTLIGDLIPTLPTGLFKILFDGGPYLSAVSVLQFDGPSGTSLQVAYDTSPTLLSAKKAQRRTVREIRAASKATRVFRTLRK